MRPETLRALTPACLPPDAPRDGARRAVPCDVAHELARSGEDIAALRRYAHGARCRRRRVAGSRRRRMPRAWCFPTTNSASRAASRCKTMALPSGADCHSPVARISWISRSATMCGAAWSCGYSRRPRTRSGCCRCTSSPDARAIRWTPARRGCAELARQVPALESWIDAQARERRAFAVLGDFNRDLRREPPGVSLWGDIDDADPPEADLVNTAEGQTFQNCSPSQTFSGYIDYIVLGRRVARGTGRKTRSGASFTAPQDAARRKLSDHCPVFIRLRVADATAASS